MSDPDRKALEERLEALRVQGRAPRRRRRLRDFANCASDLALQYRHSPDRYEEWEGLMDEAIAAYRTLLETSPRDGALLTSLGASLLDRGGSRREATSLLRRAIVESPGDRNAHYNLAVALLGAGERGRREARGHFEKAALLEDGSETREAYFDPHGY